MPSTAKLQPRVLALIVVGMSLILVLSAYLHDVVTRELIEEDRYNSAVAQTVAVGAHIASHELLSKPDALRRQLHLVVGQRKEFEQIDVFVDDSDSRHLLATTDTAAARLPVLDDHSADNELQEMEHPAQDVVTQEVVRNHALYWVISMTVRSSTSSAYITALVLKNSYVPLVRRLQLRHNLILAGASAVCVALFGWLFVTFFRRPAREIVEAMERARGGSFESRVAVRRDDELGEIGQGFNALMDDLSARDRERDRLVARINGFNTELRAEVDRATAELRLVNEELLEAQQRLERSARLAVVGQVAASLAHEIGTPLNSISGHLHLLGRRYPGDLETQRRVIVINQQLETIVGSVRALLNRTRPRAVSLQEIDPCALIGDLLRLVGPTLDNHHIEIHTNLAADMPYVLADRDSLHQVLLNLINNSIDAMPTGGDLFIEMRANHAAGTAEIVVRDSGPGIDPGALEHLFEPMWTSKVTGNGFGLAIARAIMDDHGGGIEVDTSVTDGASFRLWVPLAGAASATA
jgi:two-component system, NtrC family, sensor kinase